MNVSVVIPLHNKVRHIRRAIDSVLAQSQRNFELIVVDDGSTDESADVVRSISDPRVRLIVQNNEGECAARNRGIREAAAELIAFLDADDEWGPSFLATVLDLRSRYPAAGLYASAYRFCKGEKSWRPNFICCVSQARGGLLDDYFQAAIGPPPVISSAVMIPRAVFTKAGCFPVGVRWGGDLHTWARIALRYRVAWSPLECAIYHLSADNRACKLVGPTTDTAAAPAIEAFLRSGDEPISSRSMVEEYLVSRRLPIVLDCHLNGKKRWARRLLKKTHGTQMFRSKRLVLQFVILIPPRILRAALSVKAALRRMWSWRRGRGLASD